MKHFKKIIALTLTYCMSSMFAFSQHQTDTTITSRYDNVPLSITIVEPQHPKAVIQLVHGMCEHKERYIPFINYLVDNNYAVIIHDHRGHGASVLNKTEDLGYFYDGGYQAMIADAQHVGSIIKKRYPQLPFFLFGHSMGSMVVRSYVKNNDSNISALIVCGSPSYNSQAGLGKKLAKNAAKKHGPKSRPKFIQNLSFNSFNRKFKHEKMNNSWICSDSTIVSAYNKNPLCNFQFTANGFYNLFGLMQYTYDTKNWKLSNPELPILFISGEDDPCAAGKRKFEQAQKFMTKAGYKNINAIMYPDMRHEIINEIGKEKVWADIIQFCEQYMTTNKNQH